MSTSVTFEDNGPVTCTRCNLEMTYANPSLGPNGGYVHKGTGRVECAPEITAWRDVTKPEMIMQGDEYLCLNAHDPIWQPCTASIGHVASYENYMFRRRIEQPAQPITSGVGASFKCEVCGKFLPGSQMGNASDDRLLICMTCQMNAAEQPAPVLKPIPKALYSCACGCSVEYTWPADDLFWSPIKSDWFARECWQNEEYGKPGISLADELKSRGNP